MRFIKQEDGSLKATEGHYEYEIVDNPKSSVYTPVLLIHNLQTGENDLTEVGFGVSKNLAYLKKIAHKFKKEHN